MQHEPHSKHPGSIQKYKISKNKWLHDVPQSNHDKIIGMFPIFSILGINNRRFIAISSCESVITFNFSFALIYTQTNFSQSTKFIPFSFDIVIWRLIELWKFFKSDMITDGNTYKNSRRWNERNQIIVLGSKSTNEPRSSWRYKMAIGTMIFHKKKKSN